MKTKKIAFPTKLNEINPFDDNIDVVVTLEDDTSYILVVATPQNIITLMERQKTSYISAGTPFAFVDKLTHDNIVNVVNSFCEDDAYWLKYYHSAGEIGIVAQHRHVRCTGSSTGHCQCPLTLE